MQLHGKYRVVKRLTNKTKQQVFKCLIPNL